MPELIIEKKYSKHYPESRREWDRRNQDKVRAVTQRHRKKYEGTLKLKRRQCLSLLKHRYKIYNDFFDMYGGCCACCGKKDRRFLDLDHVQGDGCRAREEPGGANTLNAYKKALQQYCPKKYQILCIECNIAKERFGECPHRSDSYQGHYQEYNYEIDKWELKQRGQVLATRDFPHKGKGMIKVSKNQATLCYLDQLRAEHGELTQLEKVADMEFINRNKPGHKSKYKNPHRR